MKYVYGGSMTNTQNKLNYASIVKQKNKSRIKKDS